MRFLRPGLATATAIAALSGPGISPEASGFLARLATPPTVERKALYVALIDGLVADGVYAKSEAVWVWAAFDEATANTNLISSSFTVTPAAAAPTFAQDRGYTGNGTSSHLLSGFVPSASAKFLQNDCCMGAWARTNAAAAVQPLIGRTSATFSTNLYPRYTSDLLRSQFNGGALASLGPAATAVGFSCVERLDGTTIEGFKNGVSIGTGAGTSTGRPATQMAFLRDDTIFSGQQIAAGLFAARLGAALQLAAYNRLNTFLAGVGAA